MNAITRNPLILPVYLPTLFLSFCRGMLLPVLPLYAKTFHISYALIGLFLAADGIGTLSCDVPAGLLLRKIGRKAVMILGVSCVALAVLALFFAATITQAIGCQILSGIGSALWNLSRHAYIADVTPLYQRGRAISIFGGVNRIGSFAGPAVGGAIAGFFGLRAPFLLCAGLASVAILTSALFVGEPEGRPGKSGRPHNGQIGHLQDVFKANARPLLTAGSGQLFAQMIRRGRQIVIPLYAADILGLNVEAVGWILSISSFIDMCMFYPAGHLMDRHGRKYAIVPCFFTQSVGMALIPFTGSFAGLLAAASLMGLGNGLGSGTMMTLGADLAPKESMGEFLGLWRVIGDGGQLGAPLVVGWVADLAGLSPATFVIAGVGFLAGSIFAFLVPETLQARPPRPS